jgi:predicted TIM-barrel fold metal-dependent hydrolase
MAQKHGFMFIDTNAYIGQWPFRRTPDDTVDALLAKFSHYGVEQAWTGSYEGILHKDIAAVNERLVEACRQHDNGILIPFGSVNPVLPQWEEDLRRCAEVHRMKGIRLHPNYHGYTLDDGRFKALLEQASAAKLVVQLVVTMEDERMMHPLMQVAHVDVAPLADVVSSVPRLNLVLLNAFRAARGEAIDKLVATKQVWFDIAWLEGIAGIDGMSKQIPLEHLLFGSYAPFFYFESSLFKLKESALTDETLALIQGGSARALLG